MLLRLDHRSLEGGPVEAGVPRRGPLGGRGWHLAGAGSTTGGGEQPFQLVERPTGRPGIDLAVDLVGDGQHTLLCVIEDDEMIEATENRDWQIERIRGAIRQTLDQAHEVVAEEADETAGQRNRSGLTGDSAQDAIERLEWRTKNRRPNAPALDLQSIGKQSVQLAWPGAHEAEAGHLLAAGNTLEQEANR